MGTQIANGDSRLSELSFWPRVREFAVPASMIETATARRLAGDWAGACAAAGIDVDLHLRSVARDHGRDVAARVRADLRHLAPDLLRWHMPRIAPDGLLRPGLTLALARYDGVGRDTGRPLQFVARTPPAWADAGQRISLALWGGSRAGAAVGGEDGAGRHPHPRPNRRFRLDLHRHLWDAGRAGELRIRSGASGGGPPARDRPGLDPELLGRTLPYGRRCAVDRWADEARILLRAEGRSEGALVVRLGGRRRLVLELLGDGDGDGDGDAGGDGRSGGSPVLRISAATKGRASALPVLPDAATWVLPDLELLRAGAIEAGRLHPLVASALVPDQAPPSRSSRPSLTTDPAGQPRLVECRGAQHRIGLVDGVLAPLDHDPAEIRREELLAALTGTPLPCLQAIDVAHRHPSCLPDVRERLCHGDTAGALAVVEGLLGPDAVLRDGALRDELEAAARQRITYGLFRAGLAGPAPGRRHIDADERGRPRDHRARPRHATFP
ncbi:MULTISPECIES: hypothetical protein [unclassified Streptomyces]|uniref:hypothetical protein n=1 Tax=unclassified Streptomyces TaxID=2593676 RepID=UPI0023657289|nr:MULTISPECIES: hypothetical protein [unclassified Streptomyces]MDF3144022.1 hypothetical protein [Streptomyces sp. T21Q-yed]WDF39789.1 hypothetical protein PBV52_24820 [Streptomyces sp. T12]